MVLLLLLLAIAPVTAHIYVSAPREDACYTSGAYTYRVASTANAADYRVRIANENAGPDLRMQIVDRPDLADIVVDDQSPGVAAGCKTTAPITTVRVDHHASDPNVTASVSTSVTNPHYKLFVRSTRFSDEEIAALVAVMAISQPKYRLVDEPEPPAR